MSLQLIIGIVLAACILTVVITELYKKMSAPTGDPSAAHEVAFLDPNEVPMKRIGGSTIQPVISVPPGTVRPVNSPIFKSLRAEATEEGIGKWVFKIRFVFVNTLVQAIAIDDMHARVYEKNVPTPAYATINYRGDILLLQDNTMW